MMDLLAIFSSLRRHKIIMLIVLLLALGGDLFIAFGIPPVYESQAQYVLISPPPLPSDTQIEKNPSLGKLNTNNPYLRLPSPSVVVAVLAERVSGDNVRAQLKAAGADKNYTIGATNAIGSGVVIVINGTGQSTGQTNKTLELVAARMKSELHDMQTINGADDRYLYQALPINPPTTPLRKVTGPLRSLIAVTAAGVVLLFALISIAEAIGPRRTKPVTGVPRPREGGDRQGTGSAGGDSELTVILPRMFYSESRKRARG
jgi:hypothetical protein